MRELLHDSTELEWTERNETEWRALKTTLTTFPVPAYYDQDKQRNFPQMLQMMVWVLSHCRQRETAGSQWHLLLDP